MLILLVQWLCLQLLLAHAATVWTDAKGQPVQHFLCLRKSLPVFAITLVLAMVPAACIVATTHESNAVYL